MLLRRLIFTLCLVAAASATPARAISFDLDSIASWGKFARFCINTYRWGDTFFNGYDTAYVKPTGYRMNVRAKSDNWLQSYSFRLDNDMTMDLVSTPSTSLGVYLSYMAVSMGYDVNISKYFMGATNVRKRFDLQFNCSLFAASLSYLDNNSTTTITNITQNDHKMFEDIKFKGVEARTLMANLFYFFNHKRYSYAAAYSFGRKQVRSAGSFFLGLEYWNQNYNFDFSYLPEWITDKFPHEWEGHVYKVNTKNIGLKAGYAYNFVVSRNWMLGVSESPTIGVSKSLIRTTVHNKWSVGFTNHAQLSAVWNNRKWFAGAIGRLQTSLAYDRQSVLINNYADLELTIGYRFNLW